MPQSERVGWFEVYRCGCISDTVRRKRDLLGYCPKHGDDSRGPQRDLRFVAASAERKREPLTPPYTPAEEVVGMLVVGIHGIRDHNLDEMEWAIDLAAKLEALIDARIRLAAPAEREGGQDGR